MLTVVTPREAREIILSCVNTLSEAQSTDLYRAAGRVLAQDALGCEDLPAFPRSCADGLALRAGDTYGCGEALPAMLEYRGKILMGQKVTEHLPEGCCMEIPTGGMLPQGADAVAMVEYTQDIGDSFRYVLRPCAVFENVIRKGDDYRAGSIAVKRGTRLCSRSIALLAALGIGSVNVTKEPLVGIISTGDEVIEFTKKPRGSQIRDINTVTLHSCAVELGCSTSVYPIVPDNEDLLYTAVEAAARECDCVLISGGSSVGEKDAVCRVLGALADIKFHGVAVKPGKPTIFATLGGKPVFGLPGHPAAAFFAFQLLVKPALLKLLGSNEGAVQITAAASQNIPSNHGRSELIAVRLDGGQAVPLFAKSGAVGVLSDADGYITIGRDDEGVLKGDAVEVVLF